MARNCFAPGCDSGYSAAIARNKALGKKNPSLFCAPKEAALLEKWQRAIPRKDKVFAPPSKLCELHFDEGCILRTYEKELFDGSVFVYKRGRPSLKPGSVPTKFPNLPKYLSSETPNRKAPTSRSKRKRESSEKMLELTHSQIMNDSKDLEKTGELEVNSIEKPDGWNIYKNDNGHILCIKLDADCRFERHIVITHDYSVKIFLRNKEIKLANESKIQNVQNLSLLLKNVDDLVICNHLESWQLSQSCLGFASECPSQNVNICSICQDHNRTQTTFFQRRMQMISQKKIRFAMHKKYALRKNARLIKKVSQLKQEVRKAWMDCRNIKDVLQSAICDLSPEQQIAIKTCVAAAKCKTKNSIRYPLQWIYECLLLRIKGKKAYEHLRQHNILTLPSQRTLAKYISKIKGAYGFQQSTFACLEKKASVMNASDRRGKNIFKKFTVKF